VKAEREKPDLPCLDIAPLLDVTFLLLVFFLCSIRFKTLEGRLDTLLPRDLGRCGPANVVEPVTIRIVEAEHGSQIYVARRPVARIEGAVAGREIRLPSLAAVVHDLHAKLPDAKFVIDPDPHVPHGHVVAVLDTLLEEEATNLLFTMPNPASRPGR